MVPNAYHAFLSRLSEDASWFEARYQRASEYYARLAAVLHYFIVILGMILQGAILATGADRPYAMAAVSVAYGLQNLLSAVLAAVRPDDASARMRLAMKDWWSLANEIDQYLGWDPDCAGQDVPGKAEMFSLRTGSLKAASPAVPLWMDFFVSRWLARRHLPQEGAFGHHQSSVLRESSSLSLSDDSNPSMEVPVAHESAHAWSGVPGMEAPVRESEA